MLFNQEVIKVVNRIPFKKIKQEFSFSSKLSNHIYGIINH